MTRLLPALVTLALLTRPSVAYAAEPDPCRDEPRPCALRKGARAPWDGELWPSAFAMAVLEDRAAGQKAAAALAETQASLEAERKLRAIDRTEAEAVLAAERRAHAATRELARSLVEPSWGGWPWVAAGLGAVAGGLIVYALR